MGAETWMHGQWRAISEAPRDRTPILAITGVIEDERYSHWSHRMFVIFHLGTTSNMGLDMGWSLFPGMGVGDEWLAAWMPLPEPPKAPDTGEGEASPKVQEGE